jgi:glycogen operon protein
MLRMGDELGHTQGGNNNAYCQDNDISWLDWSSAPYADLVAQLLALRAAHPVFRQRAFFQGHPVGPEGAKDLAWFTPAGVEMVDADWSAPTAHTLGMFLHGDGIRTRGARGERIVDSSFLVLLHAGADDTAFCLPGPPWGERYVVELDTGENAGRAGSSVDAGADLALTGRSVVVLRVDGGPAAQTAV